MKLRGALPRGRDEHVECARLNLRAEQIDQTKCRIRRCRVTAPTQEYLVSRIMIVTAGRALAIDELIHESAPALQEQGAVVQLNGQARQRREGRRCGLQIGVNLLGSRAAIQSVVADQIRTGATDDPGIGRPQQSSGWIDDAWLARLRQPTG